MENKRSSYWAIVSLACYVLPFFFLPFFYKPTKSPLAIGNNFGVFIIACGSLSIVSAIIAIILHKREEETGWRSSGRRILAVFACCMFPLFCPFLIGILQILSPFFRTDEMYNKLYFGFLIAAGLLGVVVAVFSIREDELKGRTLAIIVILPAVLEIVAGLFISTFGGQDSCGPYVYSSNGEEFVFDSEPYAGAIFIERTDYTKLNYLAGVNGHYKLKITNELNETHYTDELKLQVIDHPIGTEVIADEKGGIHTIASPATPVSAYQKPAIDIVYLISDKDNKFWPEHMHSDGAESIFGQQEELILEFPKPENAKIAKLVISACNTLGGSSISSGLLKYVGGLYPVMSAFRSHARQGFVRFDLQVWQGDKWVTKGFVRGSSPYLPRDRLITIDVSMISGACLKLRLTPRAGFWQINRVIVDYSEDMTVNMIELDPRTAIDKKGENIKEALSKNDDDFYVAGKGDYAIITYDEPTCFPNKTRSFILKASGFYSIGIMH